MDEKYLFIFHYLILRKLLRYQNVQNLRRKECYKLLIFFHALDWKWNILQSKLGLSQNSEKKKINSKTNSRKYLIYLFCTFNFKHLCAKLRWWFLAIDWFSSNWIVLILIQICLNRYSTAHFAIAQISSIKLRNLIKIDNFSLCFLTAVKKSDLKLEMKNRVTLIISSYVILFILLNYFLRSYATCTTLCIALIYPSTIQKRYISQMEQVKSIARKYELKAK